MAFSTLGSAVAVSFLILKIFSNFMFPRFKKEQALSGLQSLPFP
jgi:hypothetical protein